MQLTNNPITVAGSVDIQQRFMKILFTITVAAASTAAAKAAIASAKIAMTKSHSSYGTETVIYEMLLKDLLEIAAANEGAVTYDTIDGATQRITATVELSDTGAIEPMPQEIYKLTLSSLAAGVSVVLNNIDVPKNAYNQLQYKPFPTASNAPTSLNVTDSKWLCLPKTAFVSIELQTDGHKIVYTGAELDQLTKEINPLAMVADGKVTQGSIDMYCIVVGWARRALITTNSVVNVILVNDTNI